MNTTNEETKFYSWSCTTKQHQQRIDTVFVRNLLTSIFLISISWLEKGKPLKLCTQKYVAVAEPHTSGGAKAPQNLKKLFYSIYIIYILKKYSM